MPNTTIASAGARLAGPRCAAATAASSARSAGEYGAGAPAPGNGVARCPGGPCLASASRYNADRYLPRVAGARPPGRPRRTPRSRHNPAGIPSRAGPRGHQRTGTAPAAQWRSSPAPRARRTASARWHQLAPNCPLAPASPGTSLQTYTFKARVRRRHAGRAAIRSTSAGSWPRRGDATTRPQRRPGQGSDPGGPRPDRLLPARHITIRRARCGKPRCACAADPASLHGPYIQWTRTVNGKTVTRLLTPAQYQAYAPWFGNTRRLRALTAELQALSLQEMARAEGWATITPARRPRPAPSSPGSRTAPYHPKRREISPLNPGTAHRQRHVTRGQLVLSLPEVINRRSAVEKAMAQIEERRRAR